MGIVVDPIRRALPLDEWPPADQALWRAALTAGDLFDQGGGAAHWAVKNPADQHQALWSLARVISHGPAPLTPTQRRPTGSPARPCGRTTSISRRCRPDHPPVDAGRSQGHDAGDGP